MENIYENNEFFASEMSIQYKLCSTYELIKGGLYKNGN